MGRSVPSLRLIAVAYDYIRRFALFAVWESNASWHPRRLAVVGEECSVDSAQLGLGRALTCVGVESLNPSAYVAEGCNEGVWDAALNLKLYSQLYSRMMSSAYLILCLYLLLAFVICSRRLEFFFNGKDKTEKRFLDL